MKIITLDSTPSTNTWLRKHPDTPHATFVAARDQTAGRGQRGNTWESEPGMNLTFSVIFCPKMIKPDRQFAISRAVSLAIVDILRNHLPHPESISVKWPNDIYAGERKICGILIENSISCEHIIRSIAGIGLNVNQKQFFSDAPNPVSMTNLAGRCFDLDQLLQETAETIIGRFEAEDAACGTLTEKEYMSTLWRRGDFYPYRTPDGDRFDADIAGVDQMGFLTLRHRDGTLSRHAFKEVIPILQSFPDIKN